MYFEIVLKNCLSGGDMNQSLWPLNLFQNEKKDQTHTMEQL